MPSIRTSVLMSVLLCVASFGGGALVMLWLRSDEQPPVIESVEWLSEARDALEARDLPRAAECAGRIPAGDKYRPEALLILGEVATRNEQHDAALAHYDQIPRDGSETDVRARLASGEILLRRGRLQAAHDDFRYSLDHFPEATFARNRLVLPLEYSGRRFEAAEEIFRLITADAFSERHLTLISDPAPVQQPPSEAQRKEPDPDDAMVNLANGRMAFYRDDFVQAQVFFEQALRQSPDLVEAWVRLGEIFLQRKDFVALAEWHERGPGNAEWHPHLWLILARWAEAVGDNPGACRCYWETLRRDPNTQMACYRLSRLLPIVRPDADASAYLRRAVQLEEMARIALMLHNNEHHLDSMRQAAQLCAEMGRVWEAAGWSRAALVIEPRLDWAAAILRDCEPVLVTTPTRQDPRLDPAVLVDLSDFPLPIFESQSIGQEIARVNETSSGPRFVDESSQVGLDFTYFNSPDLETDSGRMFEFTGGGMGAIDFDQDGWTDLYWVQGCRWPAVAGQTEFLDRLQRNVRGRVRDVTESAHLYEDRFGQGVAVGDFDQDGWPDVYVANMRQNRLWHNLGDGTFEDVTDAAGLTEVVWTSSCLVADLNGDALPDLVDVNYAQGDDVFDRICQEDGVFRSCSPLIFQGANDAAFLNLGNGRFQVVSDECAFGIGDGRGLGIVAFRSTAEDRQLNLFIANDMTANFSFANDTSERGGLPRLREQAVLNGLAFDINGTSQACMGVAAADVDRNGLLDFCVTNFYSESNNLYLQFPGGLYNDEAVACGLRDPSYHMLGFGAQFLDVDWDGWQDLVVANGHVDDFTHIGTPYRMRPQLFHNRGDAKFVELPAEHIGEYFSRELLGRGLARLDWNRDRKEDFAVSHLEVPAALVINRTATDGHAISLRLRGTAVDRDAIGTIVTVEAGGDAWTHQLTAGDGFESSNERRLVIGVGAAESISQLRVDWIDGDSSVFRDIAVDADYTLVQGGRLILTPHN